VTNPHQLFQFQTQANISSLMGQLAKEHTKEARILLQLDSMPMINSVPNQKKADVTLAISTPTLSKMAGKRD
jgi:hypothetical protein